LPDGKFVLASPLAGWNAKQWPLERFEELASLLEMPLVVNGSPDSAEMLQRVRGAHVHISGIAGLIDATRRAHAVIGVDSGPMHLAAALAKPGVAIFGTTDPTRNGPYGGSLRVLRSGAAVTTYKRDAADTHMRAIGAEAVAEALAAVLESKPAGCSA
jgi:heptosyltransferase-1